MMKGSEVNKVRQKVYIRTRGLVVIVLYSDLSFEQKLLALVG